ncbi:ubiquitin carboxyl-terminal hydrolase 30 [Patella vulgata]|uniref:ubiquitin carboxyl-terminal hydrolase 30 n=1 Tax=Patella vulgata TaxID=6465 RepID=UPI0021806BD2|nr:ubiquitin carboxyl-terminal hydrolase 30 [Patella vulgata]
MFARPAFIISGVAAVAALGSYIFWGPPKKKKTADYCPGLVNFGNTCFLNAVLQSWSACPSVSVWLGNFLSRHVSTSTVKKYLAATILKVLRLLNNDGDCELDPFSPGEVLEALRRRGWIISPDEQDSHELFHVLTQTLEEETSRYPSVVSLFDVQALQNPCNKYQPDGVAFIRSQGKLPILPRREMDHPFRGLLASQLECYKCKYRYPVKYDLFDSLSLSFPQKYWGPLTLDQLLRHFICPETVNNVDCPGCAKILKTQDIPKSSFKKKLTIGKLPQCLCIHIQRKQWLNSNVPVKRYDHIAFSEILHMDNYVYMKANKKNLCYRNGLFGGNDDTLDSLRFGTQNQKLMMESAPVNLLRALNYDSSTMNGIFVQPPNSLNMHNIHADENHNGPEIKPRVEFTYKLASVVSHQGNECSGHFVSYRRNPVPCVKDPMGSKWLFTSDENVRKTSFTQVLNSEAYMLFYERV